MITRDDGQSLQKRESQKIRETESEKLHQIAYTTLLHYLHDSLQNRPNNRLVQRKPQNRKSCQGTARYMAEASLPLFPFPLFFARFLSFFPLPASLRHKEASAEERGEQGYSQAAQAQYQSLIINTCGFILHNP